MPAVVLSGHSQGLRCRDPARQRVRRVPGALRLRLATSLLYGNTSQQQEAALTAPDPTALPWIAAALTQLGEILADLAS